MALKVVIFFLHYTNLFLNRQANVNTIPALPLNVITKQTRQMLCDKISESNSQDIVPKGCV